MSSCNLAKNPVKTINVCFDTNKNGRCDMEDTALPNVILSINGQNYITNSNGQIILESENTTINEIFAPKSIGLGDSIEAEDCNLNLNKDSLKFKDELDVTYEIDCGNVTPEPTEPTEQAPTVNSRIL